MNQIERLTSAMTQLTANDWEEVIKILKGSPDGDRATRKLMKCVLEKLANTYRRAATPEEQGKAYEQWHAVWIGYFCIVNKGVRLKHLHKIDPTISDITVPASDVSTLANFPTRTQ